MTTPISDPIVIVGAARTPMGAFQGDFSALAAHDLGGAAIKAAVARAAEGSTFGADAVGEVAHEAAHGRACGADDDDGVLVLAHVISPGGWVGNGTPPKRRVLS